MSEIQNQNLIPTTDNTISLGENSKRFTDVYAVEFHGTATYSGSTLSLANQNLGNLADVTVSGVGVDDVLSWNGSAWVPNAICNPTTLSSLTDVDTTGVVSGQVLRFNSSSNKFEAETLTPQSFNVTFTSLTDTPSTLTASGFIKVNSGGTALEVVADPGYISDLSGFTTANLTENTNLYYTDTRFDTRLASKSTSHLTEGTNLYYTNARVDARLSNKTTDDFSEGTNLYFTNARADARITAASLTDLSDVNTGATSGQVLKWNGSAWAPANDVPGSDSDSIPEGSTNLYYTDSRWDTRLGTKTTDNLTEGSSNFYYTVARANSAIDARLATTTVSSLQDVTIASITSGQILKWNGSAWTNQTDSGHTNTDSLTEGSTNFYYTDARADARVNLQTGTNLDISSKNTSHLTEGSNLYFTNARADARIAAANLSDLVDVHTTSPTNGQVLKWDNANSRWAPGDDDSASAYSNFNSDFDTRIATKSTTHLTEGNNLYYTNARFDSRLANKSTSDIAEGSRLYFTTQRVLDAIGTVTTDNLPEGSSNQYHTDARVNNLISNSTLSNLSGVNVTGATNGQSLVYNSSNATWIASTVSGGGGGPANTDSLTEGSTNLYYTDARVNSLLQGSTVNYVPNSDNSVDVGSSSKRVRNIYVANLYTDSISPSPGLSGTYKISSPTTITLDPVNEIVADAPFKLVSKTVSQLQGGFTASAGSMVAVSDNGYKPAYYDGSALTWKYVATDGNV